MMRKLLLTLVLLFPAVAASAATWAPDFAQSTLQWQSSWGASPVTGVFKSWTAAIMFDPDDLKSSSITATINIASLDTRYPERDDALRGADWFDTAQHPTATFTSTDIRKTSQGYVAAGHLTLGGVSKPLALPFTLSIAPGAGGTQVATVDAKTTLSRLAFNIGKNAWKSTGQIHDAVHLSLHLVATAPAR